MSRWKDLELVETIFEEEDHQEDYSSYSPSLSPSLSPSPPTPLQSIAKTWSLATGIQTNVVIHIQDQCFHLHKDPLISKSGYLKRHLTNINEITLSPPLKITAETFSAIVDYCYTYQLVITPFNVAALRVAAELLEMTVDQGKGESNLQQKIDNYFNKAVSVNREYATLVLRSCLALLPNSESASMACKCIKTLTSGRESQEVNDWVRDIISLTSVEFQMIIDSLHERFDNHDLLYRLADLYIEEHSGKLTEEEKNRICSSVDCRSLSPHLIMHAVQNPRMPLRFIVRAMLVEQFNTRLSIISSTTLAANANRTHSHRHNNNSNQTMTLGAILQRDAAFRQVAQLKASMEATCMKIETLENDLVSMKKVLDSSKVKRESLEPERSASFRFSSERKITQGERKSNSLRFSDRREKVSDMSSSSPSFEAFVNGDVKTKNTKNFGWKLMNGLKNVLRKSPAKSKQDSESICSSKLDASGYGDFEEDGAVVVHRDYLPSHSRSLV